MLTGKVELPKLMDETKGGPDCKSEEGRLGHEGEVPALVIAEKR